MFKSDHSRKVIDGWLILLWLISVHVCSFSGENWLFLWMEFEIKNLTREVLLEGKHWNLMRFGIKVVEDANAVHIKFGSFNKILSFFFSPHHAKKGLHEQRPATFSHSWKNWSSRNMTWYPFRYIVKWIKHFICSIQIASCNKRSFHESPYFYSLEAMCEWTLEGGKGSSLLKWQFCVITKELFSLSPSSLVHIKSYVLFSDVNT
jgi:hypothetical protein